MIKDVSCFKENAMPAKASFIPYGNETEISERKSSLRVSLDGLWKFAYAKRTFIKKNIVPEVGIA